MNEQVSSFYSVLHSERTEISTILDNMKTVFQAIVDESAKSHESIESKSHTLSESFKNYKEEIELLKKNLAISENNCNSLKNTRDDVTELIQGKEQIIFKLQGQITQKDLEIRTLKDQINDNLKSQENMLENKINDYDTEIIRLKSKLAESTLEIQDIKSKSDLKLKMLEEDIHLRSKDFIQKNKIAEEKEREFNTSLVAERAELSKWRSRAEAAEDSICTQKTEFENRIAHFKIKHESYSQKFNMLCEISRRLTGSLAKLMNSAETMEASYTCMNCLNLFENPVVCIPCGHTFCKDCLLPTPSDTLCPECKTINNLEPSPYKSIPCNALESLGGKFSYNRQVLSRLMKDMDSLKSESDISNIDLIYK